MGTHFINLRERLEIYKSVKPLVETLRIRFMVHVHGIWSIKFGSILLVMHLLTGNFSYASALDLDTVFS